MNNQAEIDNMPTFIDPGEYVPGVCNIGPDEIERRRKFLYISIIGSIVITIVLFLLTISPVWIWVLLLPWAGTTVAYLQVRNKFCVAFGAMAIYNFTSLGSEEKIDNQKAIQQDRRKVFMMMGQSLLVGFVITAILAIIRYNT